MKEPYKSKLGENFASLFDRTGLTDAKDHLVEDYDSWIKQEMLKYFIAIDDSMYRRVRAEAKKMALEFGAYSPEYATQLEQLLVKFKNPSAEQYDDLPIVQSIKRIIEARTKATVAPEIMKNLLSDQAIKAALDTLQSGPIRPAEEVE